tara:strand:+ start:213 stop:857 length:645 start_codon:yes stop_codon:yes gene_type:complete
MIIAIDGPAASGKSVTAKNVAKKLNFLHLNTGSMYRAVTLYFINLDVDINNEAEINSALKNISILFDFKDLNKILLNGKDVTEFIRNSLVDSKVSQVSALKSVRKKMVMQQREIAYNNDIVMEGRDIGSYVFPNADYKFYLTADVRVRAKRRYEEKKIKHIDFNDVLFDLKQRDAFDKNRKFSPLIVSEDAIIIDTSTLNIDEQVDKIVKIINK